jgi:hypothetical protein
MPTHPQELTPSSAHALPLISVPGANTRLVSNPPEDFEPNPNLRRFLNIDMSIRLDGDNELAKETAINCEAAMRPNARRLHLRKVTDVISCIYANLIRLHAADETAFLGLSLGAAHFGDYERPPASRDVFSRAVKFLQNQGLIVVKRGFSDRQAYCTKIRASERLICMLAEGLRSPTTANLVHKIASAHADSVIWLRDGDRRIQIETSPEIQAMEAKLTQYNEFASRFCVDLAVPDSHITGYLIKKPDFWMSNDLDKARREEGLQFVDLTARNLRRIFTRGSIERGGRFYGAWYQNIRSALRSRITINGNATRELDYSGMQIAMLYAQSGVPLVGDPYALPGIRSEYRKVIKSLTLIMINALRGQRTKPLSGLPCPQPELVERIADRHRAISDYFHSDVGVKLQRIDSDIAEDVIISLMNQNILALPVHDSFVVEHQYVSALRREMERAYREKIGGSILIKPSGSFIDEVAMTNPESELSQPWVSEMIRLTTVQGYEHYLSRQRVWLGSEGSIQ